MNAEEEKAMRERLVFRTFLKVSGLQIDPESIESRKPPEPDILCVHECDGKLAFELVEICAEDLARKYQQYAKEKNLDSCAVPTRREMRCGRSSTRTTAQNIQLTFCVTRQGELFRLMP